MLSSESNLQMYPIGAPIGERAQRAAGGWRRAQPKKLNAHQRAAGRLRRAKCLLERAQHVHTTMERPKKLIRLKPGRILGKPLPSEEGEAVDVKVEDDEALEEAEEEDKASEEGEAVDVKVEEDEALQEAEEEDEDGILASGDAYERAPNPLSKRSKWMNLSRTMAMFLRYKAHQENLLDHDDWIQVDEDLLCRLQGTFAEVMQVVQQSCSPGVEPRFELRISGPRVWLRATNAARYRGRAYSGV